MENRDKYWEERLSAYLANVRDQEFTWGEHDCALYAVGAIKAVTGTDISEGIVGEYTTWREAAKWLKDRGYHSFEEAVSDKLGETIHVAQAGRGDIVIKRNGNGNILGVCVGKYSLFLGDRDTLDAFDNPTTVPDLIQFPTLGCEAAWKIGPVKSGGNS